MSTEKIISFSQFSLSPPLLQAIDEVGYESPSAIQAESIPPLLEGRDLVGQAQTGTGKTAAFALPLLSRLDLSRQVPQILVLTPTRELAIQVAEAMQTYARHLQGFHILPVYGGQGMDTQLRQLKRGVHAVVGTPGRILDHLRRKTLQLNNITALVLDEADEMLRMGFIDDVELILEHTPAERQVALFSATMPEPIRRVARRHLRDPVEIHIKNKTTTVSTIQQRYWTVNGVQKLDALTRILEVEDFEAIIIFVRTKTLTLELSGKLEARGYATSPLNGDMHQSLREKTVEGLRNGTLDIVVATDVAARGLDVERISHVINYDIPTDTEAYVHRIGRTGRAGRKGEAILFVSPREQRLLRAIERATHQPITPMQLPTHKDIVDHRITQFKKQITDTLAAGDLGFFEQLIKDYQEEYDVGVSEIAAALAFLLQRERPLLLSKAKSEKSTGDDSSKFAKGKNKEDSRASGSSDAPKKARRERSTLAFADKSFAANSGFSEPPKVKIRKKSENQAEPGMARYRLAVGRAHGAMPKNIVGAIANEIGLDSRDIGHIQLFDSYSTVDLPDDLPADAERQLGKIWVCGQQLRASLENEDFSEKPQNPRARRSFDKKSSAFGRGGDAKPKSKRKKP